ncbi:hypothetical protein COCNU_scaffold009051G000010 [Cocos nucifera]|nr:hypothetical protein [Cocos nucifera]
MLRRLGTPQGVILVSTPEPRGDPRVDLRGAIEPSGVTESSSSTDSKYSDSKLDSSSTDP